MRLSLETGKKAHVRSMSTCSGALQSSMPTQEINCYCGVLQLQRSIDRQQLTTQVPAA